MKKLKYTQLKNIQTYIDRIPFWINEEKLIFKKWNNSIKDFDYTNPVNVNDLSGEELIEVETRIEELGGKLQRNSNGIYRVKQPRKVYSIMYSILEASGFDSIEAFNKDLNIQRFLLDSRELGKNKDEAKKALSELSNLLLFLSDEDLKGSPKTLERTKQESSDLCNDFINVNLEQKRTAISRDYKVIKEKAIVLRDVLLNTY